MVCTYVPLRLVIVQIKIQIHPIIMILVMLYDSLKQLYERVNEQVASDYLLSLQGGQ